MIPDRGHANIDNMQTLACLTITGYELVEKLSFADISLLSSGGNILAGRRFPFSAGKSNRDVFTRGDKEQRESRSGKLSRTIRKIAR